MERVDLTQESECSIASPRGRTSSGTSEEYTEANPLHGTTSDISSHTTTLDDGDELLITASDDPNPPALLKTKSKPEIAGQTSPKAKLTSVSAPQLSKEQFRKKPKKERFEELKNIRRAMVEKMKKKSTQTESTESLDSSGNVPFGNRGNRTRKKEVQENVNKKKKPRDEDTQPESQQKSDADRHSSRHKFLERMERFRASFFGKFKHRKSDQMSGEVSSPSDNKRRAKAEQSKKKPK
ncbi:hypothetical protein L596_019320 [Steinernema carpocapsae]|uniref:Uncharacterized protein n=1 Tax=Steinernema carpocapsae TaxID=34508 RepID=A0A4U5MQC2_STECR|nr:hypothetical protein L596_019320 [Steinernema carpocapsae]